MPRYHPAPSSAQRRSRDRVSRVTHEKIANSPLRQGELAFTQISGLALDPTAYKIF
jgi:hypothetical protein